MRKEIFSRNAETNMELEKLRRKAKQYSASATLNEVFRAQLQSVKEELNSERLHSKKERLQLEEKINKFKTVIHNEKVKCKRFEEEKILNNAIMMDTEDKLKNAECDKQCYHKQMHELNIRLASTETELQKSKENFEESNNEMTLLRTERDKFKEVSNYFEERERDEEQSGFPKGKKFGAG